MRKLGIGLLISVVLAGMGFHYWELRWQLQVANFRNDLWGSENRIMRDEMNELRSKKSYEQGCLDTALRSGMDSGFNDGLHHALSTMKENDYVKGFHSATENHWAMNYFQSKIAEKKLQEEKEKSFSEGRKDGYESAIADTKAQESHDDFTPRQKLQKELDSKSPFKTVETNE